MEHKDKKIVENDVEQRRHHVAHHGVARRGVEPYVEHSGAEHGAEHKERHGTVDILDGRHEQTLRAAKQACHAGRTPHDERTERRHQHAEGYHGLSDVYARRLRLAVRQMDRRHHRRAHAEHKSDAGIYKKQRRNDIHRRQSIAAKAAANEYAVGNNEKGRRHHAEQRGHEQLAEKA